MLKNFSSQDDTHALDEQYMQQALIQAQQALDAGEIPVGAVVVCEGRRIAQAHNQCEQLQDCTAHAEMIAISAAQDHLGSRYLQNCTLYVTLEPCAMCAGAMHWGQLSRLVYGTQDPQRGFSHWQPTLLHPRTTVSEGLYSAQSKDLLQRFFKELRR